MLAATACRPSHGRVGVAAAERVEAVGRAGDVEVESEVQADGEHVAQVTLQRIAAVEALRAVAGPQRLHRLARLADGEGRVRAKAQLGFEVGSLAARRRLLERDGGCAQEV